LTAFYYDPGHYLAYDWLIVSGGVARRYRSNPERFSTQIAFYDLLGEIAAPAWSMVPEGRERGPRIDIYRIDDAFRTEIRSRFTEPSPEQLAAWRDRVHPPHFVDFLLTVAEDAEFKEVWRQAALYYGAAANAATNPEILALGLEKCGAMLFSAGDLEQSARWFEQLAGIPSHRFVGLGNLGLIAERQGDFATARDRYEELVDSDEYGDWARERLSALPD
jgi:tetratricopeptide (TPR) repeat protein